MMKAPGETAIQALETRATCRELGEQRNLVWLCKSSKRSCWSCTTKRAIVRSKHTAGGWGCR